ncbi:MAG: hypothetical protein U9R00_00580 [Patescibacteria group bacterium]|nr:hypothetical protein [Patescibacteria group bacterium]
MKSIFNNRNRIMMGLSKSLIIFILIFSFSMPAIVKAGDDSDVKISTKIENPLSENIDSIPALIKVILNIVLIIGVPIIALAIIYTGYLFVAAQGKPDKLTKAKKALVTTLIGAVLLLGSWVIANAIGNTVEEIKRTT